MINKTITIWKHDQSHNPQLETYILSGDKKRPVIIVCPGGAYDHLSSREAEPVALQFNANGYHAAILYYSVSPSRHPQPLYDLAKAVSIVREHAEEWHIQPDRIAVCGFSAGGHLAASLGVYWNKPLLSGIPEINQPMIRPNALILCYPVISSGHIGHAVSLKNLLGDNPPPELSAEVSLEKQIDKNTPPCFIWHTYADESVKVENSLLLVQALRANQIPLEFHIFPEGMHGLALATEETAVDPLQINPHVAGWFRLCIEWLGLIFR